MNLWKSASLVCLVCAVLMFGACASGINTPAPNLEQASLLAPALLELGNVSGKQTSGAPAGIRLRWSRVDDPSAAGYYVYRDTESIELPPPDGTLPELLRTNSGNPVPQPPTGPSVEFDDLFALVIGETYYYRVTVVDTNGDESYPSNELSWTVHGHSVTGLNPTSAYWGDDVTLTGDTFGAYDDTTDSVTFPNVDGGNTPGAIVSWEDTQIVVTVPFGAVTGKLSVVIEGTTSLTDEDLTILSPYILAISPEVGFVSGTLDINGANFGATQDTSTIDLASQDLSAFVTVWSDTLITIQLQPDSTGGDVTVTVDSRTSNAREFTPLPEILSTAPLTVQAGEPLTIDGRFFGDVEGEITLDGSPQAVTSWAAAQIEIVVAGVAGELELVVTDDAALVSNVYAFTVSTDLSVAITGLNSTTVYTAASPPQVGVDVPADADEVRLFVDDQLMGVSSPPFDDLQLPVALFANGTHTIHLEAQRRAVIVESATLDLIMYSLLGDVNSDGAVDLADRNDLENLIGLTDIDPLYLPWYDTDADGAVTEADLAAIGYNFGNALPPG